MKVAIITQEQKDLITGRKFVKSVFFNPVKDADYNWVISETEINNCINKDFLFLKELKLIEYNEPLKK